MIEAYRNISVPIDTGDKEITVSIPLTLSLLEKVERIIVEAEKSQRWYRFNKNQKTLLDLFREFAEEYLPRSLDREMLQPAFYSLFFSHVSEAVTTSLDASLSSTTPTDEQPKPTAVPTKVQVHPSD